MAEAGQIVSAPGSRPYELLLDIGAGGMATVFLGRAVGAGGFQRLVAVKVCHATLARDAAFRAMFLDEARIAARIHHPNVVPTLDVGEGQSLYLVMEYVEGVHVAELAERLEAAGEPFPVPIALRIALDALAGLHAAHETRDEKGTTFDLVHRDAGAHNILVGADGSARIADFGIVKAVAQTATTKEGHVKGKLGYMPPEYLHARQVGRFTDVYAIGVVLWEALAGRYLFRGETEGQTVAAVLRGDVPPLGPLRPDVPPALDAVIARALDRDPTTRYPTAAEFAAALESVGVAAASTRETAAFVTRWVGAELEARRRAIPSGDVSGALPTSTPVREPAEGRAPAQPASEPRAAWPRSWTAALMAAAAIAAALWWGLRADGPPAPSANLARPEGRELAGAVDAAASADAAPSVPVPPPAPTDADAGPTGTHAPDAGAVERPAGTRRNRVRSRPTRVRPRPAPKEWQPKDI